MSLHFLMMITLTTSLVALAGWRLARGFPRHRRLAWWGVAAAYVLALGWQFAYRSSSSRPDEGVFPFIAWPGAVTMGFWGTFLILLLATELLLLVAFAVRKALRSPPLDPSRRAALARGIPTGLLALSGTLTGVGLGQAVRGPALREVDVPVDGLAPGLEGLRIAQISDLHVGPTIHRGYVESVVAQVLAAQPDLIALTGDMADGKPEQLAAHFEPLKKLRAPLGVFYVTGNHEYYWGGEDWIQALRGIGATPLLNEHRVVERRGARLVVGGVTDPAGEKFVDSHRSSPSRALSGAPAADFRLLLAHRPDACDEALAAGFDLQLSGHTHAGQFYPWGFFVARAYRYYKGLNRHARLWVYVNAGTGYWGPPNRFGIPSEVTLLRLSRPS